MHCLMDFDNRLQNLIIDLHGRALTHSSVRDSRPLNDTMKLRRLEWDLRMANMVLKY
jgi:hypothetical protein